MRAASAIPGLQPLLPESLMKDADRMSRCRIEAIAKKRLLGHWPAAIAPVRVYSGKNGTLKNAHR